MKFEVFYPKEKNMQTRPNGGNSTRKLEVGFTPSSTFGDFLDFVSKANFTGAYMRVYVKTFFGFVPAGNIEVRLGRIINERCVPINELKLLGLVKITGISYGSRVQYFVKVK